MNRQIGHLTLREHLGFALILLGGIAAVVMFCAVVFGQEGGREDPPEYAEGKFCTPRGDKIGPLQTPNNPCACKRIDYDPECEGANMGHDQACGQYCHEKHCACPPAKCMPMPTPDPNAQGGADQ